MKTANTKKRGVARTIVFKSGKAFKAVCLDFNIIEEADTLEEVEAQVKEAVLGYIENVINNNLDDKLLNRHADKKYWNMYSEYLEVLRGCKTSTEKLDVGSILMFTTPINSKLTHCV